MPLDTIELVVTPRKVLAGDFPFTVTAGQTLKVETSPAGEDIYEDACPAGKVWAVRVYIRITETDA